MRTGKSGAGLLFPVPFSLSHWSSSTLVQQYWTFLTRLLCGLLPVPVLLPMPVAYSKSEVSGKGGLGRRVSQKRDVVLG